MPTAPSFLSDEARKEWRRMGKHLLGMGLVTEIDKAMLAAYCSAWGRLVDAEAKLAATGSVIKAPSGFIVQSPYLAIVNKAIEQLTKIAPEFGMSPSSRTRVKATPKPKEKSPLEKLRERGNG